MFKQLRNFRKRMFTPKNVLIAIAVLGIIFIVANPILGRFQERGRNTETIEAVKQDIKETVSASGKLTASQRVSLSFSAGGKLSWINVEEGDGVVSGQALAGLDTTKLNSDYQRALSDLRAAEATLDRVYDEVKNHDTDETFKQKETRTDAEVAKDKAYEAVIKAEKDLKDAVLVSLFNGIVSEISENMVSGSIISSSDKITITDPKTLYFNALVDEADFAKIKKGQGVIVTLDAFRDEKFEGTVISVGRSTIASSSGTSVIQVRVKLSFDPRFVLGLGGEAEFIIEERKDVVVIPRRAVKKEREEEFVIVLRNDKPVKQSVKTGIEEGRNIEIKEGLTAGEKIIIGSGE